MFRTRNGLDGKTTYVKLLRLFFTILKRHAPHSRYEQRLDEKSRRNKFKIKKQKAKNKNCINQRSIRKASKFAELLSVGYLRRVMFSVLFICSTFSVELYLVLIS